MKNTLRNTLNASKKRKIQQCESPAPTNQFTFKLSIEDRFKELQSEFSVNDLTESMITFDNKIIAPNSQSKKRRKLNDGTASQLYAKSQEDEKFLESITEDDQLEKKIENSEPEIKETKKRNEPRRFRKFASMKQVSTNYVKLNLKRGRNRNCRIKRCRRRKIEDDDDFIEIEEGTISPTLESKTTFDTTTHPVSFEKFEGNLFELSQNEDKLHEILKKNFNHDTFREGQKQAIQSILQNKSTLLILPTGGGKSLCYQFPALVFPNLVLVISPLISLMNDQLSLLPPCLKGALLSTHLTHRQKEAIYTEVREGKIKVLFISPERLNNEKFIKLIKEEFPPISFACIDEAHCVSEWSHNFRPSYLHLKDVLHHQLGVTTILALTATATKAAEKSICESLKIENVVRVPLSRKNLIMTISHVKDRFNEMVKLLKSDRFKSCKSIIIYTMTKADAEQLTNHLCLHGFQAKSYHSGLRSKERQNIQKQFMNNELPIIVATVAFGMGINKPDISAVIHFNLPRSLENYIQEVGRAGRDGRNAQCHLFLHPEDYIKLRSLCFSDYVDHQTIKKLLNFIFDTKKETPYECTLNMNEMEQELDLRNEVISTILSYIELQEEKFIKMLSQTQHVCKIEFLKTSSKLARRNALVKSILKIAERNKSHFIFDISDVAKDLLKSISQVQLDLEELKDCEDVKYEMSDNAFVIKVLKIPKDISLLCDNLVKKMRDIEQCQVYKLYAMYKVARQYATDSFENTKKSDELQSKIEKYFTSPNTPISAKNAKIFLNFDQIEKRNFYEDMKKLIGENQEMIVHGKIVARIFHGISSPVFDSKIWCRHDMWKRYPYIDFYTIVREANQIILNFKK